MVDLTFFLRVSNVYPKQHKVEELIIHLAAIEFEV